MSAAHTTSFPVRDQAFLCWSEAPNSPARAEVVEIVETHPSEAVVRSALKVREKTEVRLIGEKYTGNGIVLCCKKVQRGFLLTVWIMPGTEGSVTADHDPGVFAVEDFLTEEQEADILGDVEKEMREWAAYPDFRVNYVFGRLAFN
jgi:hypothetical protein